MTYTAMVLTSPRVLNQSLSQAAFASPRSSTKASAIGSTLASRTAARSTSRTSIGRFESGGGTRTWRTRPPPTAGNPTLPILSRTRRSHFAIYQHVGGSGAGIFLGRNQRRHHHRLVEDRRPDGHRAQLELHLQGALDRSSHHRPRAWRTVGTRRFDPPRRESCADHRTAYRRDQRRASVGRSLRPRFDRYLRGAGRRDAL